MSSQSKRRCLRHDSVAHWTESESILHVHEDDQYADGPRNACRRWHTTQDSDEEEDDRVEPDAGQVEGPSSEAGGQEPGADYSDKLDTVLTETEGKGFVARKSSNREEIDTKVSDQETCKVGVEVDTTSDTARQRERR